MLQRLVQKAVLSTQVPPFTWAYERAYEKAMYFVAKRLMDQHGVRSVYLVSGFLDRPIYGLSDLDFAVVVDDEDGRSLTRVRELYVQLSDYIPILDSSDEPGLFALSNMQDVFDRRPIVQYRLGPHRPKRLLMGEDLLAGVKMNASRATQALAEIDLWWELLARTRKNGGTAVETTNVARKMLADVYRAILWDREGTYVARRSEVLARLAESATSAAGFEVDPDLLERARDPLAATGAPIPFARLFEAFHALVADYLDVPAPPATHEIATDRATWSRFVETGGEPLRALRARFGDGVKPVPNLFRHGGIDEDHHGTVRRVHLRLGRLPTADEIAFAEDVRKRARALDLFVEHDGVLYPLGGAGLYGVTGRSRSPELFPDDSGDAANAGGVPNAGGVARIGVGEERFAEIRGVLEARAAMSLRAVGSPTLWKADIHRLTEQLVTSAESARAAALPPGARRLELVSAPEQLLAFWPDASESERETLARAARLLEGPERVTDAKVPVEDLHAMVALLSRLHGTTPPGPAEKPTKLTMSVVIITRNRADLLRKAIASLTRQHRVPDELVVVDNGSSDHTREVVESFRDALNVVYVHLAEPSIPKARNAGARAATQQIIAFVDDDEVVEPQWLAQAERTFLRDPKIGVVGGENVNVEDQKNLIADFFREYLKA